MYFNICGYKKPMAETASSPPSVGVVPIILLLGQTIPCRDGRLTMSLPRACLTTWRFTPNIVTHRRKFQI